MYEHFCRPWYLKVLKNVYEKMALESLMIFTDFVAARFNQTRAPWAENPSDWIELLELLQQHEPQELLGENRFRTLDSSTMLFWTEPTS